RRHEFLRWVSVRRRLRRAPGAHTESHARAADGYVRALREPRRRGARTDRRRALHGLRIRRRGHVALFAGACRGHHAAARVRLPADVSQGVVEMRKTQTRIGLFVMLAATTCWGASRDSDSASAGVAASNAPDVAKLVRDMTLEEKLDLIGGTG